MTTEERAREFLCMYLDMLDGLGTAKVNRDVHYAKLTALLTELQAEARLAEAKLIRANWNVDDSIRNFCQWIDRRIAALEAAIHGGGVSIRSYPSRCLARDSANSD